MDGRQLAAATARQGLRTAASAAPGGAKLWLRLAVPIAVVVAALAGLLLLVVLLAAAGGPAPAAASGGMLGINPTILSAYLQAAQLSPGIDRGCEVRWQVLAGIGRVESNHGQHWGPRTEIRGNGDVAPPIIGPRLDGTQGTARITDTDQGRWDRDTVYDRAVGPMQFIPSSWEVFGQDGNGDGRADPHNVFDATLAAAAHLCWAPAPPSSGVKDLSDAGELAAALFSYNRSQAYVSTVLGWIDYYDTVELDGGGDVVAAGTYTLPVDRELVTRAQLLRPHHDYPAWDFATPIGTAVYTAHGGVVVGVSAAGSRCGNGVTIAGDDGYHYIYCHGSQVYVGWGQRVAAGSTLMASGNTGNSTGPHLHFGIRDAAGRNLCPQDLLAAWYDGVPLSPVAARSSGCSY